jgi:hypothetical protein
MNHETSRLEQMTTPSSRLARFLLIPIHTSILAVTSLILPLLASSREEVSMAQGIQPWFISVAAALIVFMVFRKITNSGMRASIATAGITIVFFSCGHFHSLLQECEWIGMDIDRQRYLLSMAVLLMVIWIWYSLRILTSVKSIVMFLHAVPLAAFFLPLLRIGSDLIDSINSKLYSIQEPLSLEISIDYQTRIYLPNIDHNLVWSTRYPFHPAELIITGPYCC